MEFPLQFFAWSATILSVLSPWVFIAIREAIKLQRQEIITDLSRVFNIGANKKFDLIPSFEFVKYKYFVGGRRSDDPDAFPEENARRYAASVDFYRKREDYTIFSWLIGSSPFCVVSAIGVYFLTSQLINTSLYQAFEIGRNGQIIGNHQASLAFGTMWTLGICASFAGSYITALRNFHRAVKNFDLSPQSIVSETIKILLSVIMGPITIVSLLWIGSELVRPLLPPSLVQPPSSAVAFIICACFVAGVMPEVALRYIIQRDKLKNFKREENEVFQAFKVTPVEIIDGIDSEIRARLEDHHIHSTQNLATANPLMLFVETPFGVYQIMDWVAQAQLCCSVGRDKIIRLWPLGVRTLFDLERLVDGSSEHNMALLLEVGRVILGPALVPQDVKDRSGTAALIRTSIELRLDDPHVQRLRQIYIAVGDRLGSKSRRFRVSRFRIVCRRLGKEGWVCRGRKTG